MPNEGPRAWSEAERLDHEIDIAERKIKQELGLDPMSFRPNLFFLNCRLKVLEETIVAEEDREAYDLKFKVTVRDELHRIYEEIKEQMMEQPKEQPQPIVTPPTLLGPNGRPLL